MTASYQIPQAMTRNVEARRRHAATSSARRAVRGYRTAELTRAEATH